MRTLIAYITLVLASCSSPTAVGEAHNSCPRVEIEVDHAEHVIYQPEECKPTLTK